MSYQPTRTIYGNGAPASNPMSIPTVGNGNGPQRQLGFHPQQTSPMDIPSASHGHMGSSHPSNSVKAVKLDLFHTRREEPFKPHYGFAPPSIGNPASTATGVPPSPPAAAAFNFGNGHVSLSPFSTAPSSTAQSSGASSAASSNFDSSSTSSAMLISPPHASVAGSANFSFTPPFTSSINQPQAHSMPVSLPAFRRAVSFVGLDQGFDLVAPELDNIGRMPPAQQQPMGVAPKIQNFSSLGQQLRQHFNAQGATGSNSSNGAPQSNGTTGGMQRTHSNVTMVDAQSSASHDSSVAPSSTGGMKRTPSNEAMVDADALPEISSPPPSAALQFSFDSGEMDPHEQASNLLPGPRLNFDAVHINSKDQVLGAIPHVRTNTPPQVAPLAPTSLHVPSSRWTPLSSSAPSQLFSSLPFRARRDSAGSTASNALGSVRTNSNPLTFAAHRDVHTPTTIASVASEQDGGMDDGSAAWSDNDSMDDAEIEGRVDHNVHGDGDECSLSSCSSCSAESSDFSANLEDDFEAHVSLTFRPSEDEVGDAVRSRLNQQRREHHVERHLHHRRRKMRRLMKQQREEAKARGEPLHHASSDDIKNGPLNEDEIIAVGQYTQGERQRKIQRYLEKRRRRVWSKKILYSCRKNFADKRPRIGGRFVKINNKDENDPSQQQQQQESFSLSTSPGASGVHTPTGLLAYAQHVHGLSRGGQGQMTAFSLPLSNYPHTTFSPSSASPSERPSFSLQMPVNDSMGNVGTGSLSFFKETSPHAFSPSSSSHPSGLSAALTHSTNAAAAPTMTQQEQYASQLQQAIASQQQQQQRGSESAPAPR